MKGSFRFITITVTNILTYVLIYIALIFNSETYINNYFDGSVDDFNFWKINYLTHTALWVTLVSIVIIVIWNLIYNSNRKNSHTFHSSVFRDFLLFLLLQVIVSSLFAYFTVNFPTPKFILYSLLFILTYMVNTIYLSTPMVSGIVVPVSDSFGFKVIFGTVVVIVTVLLVFIF